MTATRITTSSTEMTPAPRRGGPTVALALGGGGARGLAHIPMLEAFDELGIRPKVIAGTSIGAIFGAAYAAGLTGREIRIHTEELLSQRFGLLRELFNARTRDFTRLLGVFPARSALLDPHRLLDIVMPQRIDREFAALDIPLKIVATDFYAQEPVVFTSGPVMHAVAASMALPVIFQPVLSEGRALIDGGLTNPLPFDLVAAEADITVAIDVSGAPAVPADRPHPNATEALFSSPFIFERTIIREKLKATRPDLYLDAGTRHFQILDFLNAREIMAAAEPAKEKLKVQLTRLLSAEPAVPLPPAERTEPEKPARVPLLGRGRRRKPPAP
jgi:NTE family protein